MLGAFISNGNDHRHLVANVAHPESGSGTDAVTRALRLLLGWTPSRQGLRGVSEFGGVEKAPLVCRPWIRSAEKERRSTARAASPPLPSRPWPAEAPRGRWRRRPTSFHGPQALTRQDTGGHGAYNGDYPPGP